MASTYLTRTPSGDGNRKTMTFSFWFKRSILGSTERIFSTWSNSAANQFWIRWTSSNELYLVSYTSSSFTTQLITTQLFRDVSAWYHIVIAYDTTQATASNRIKLYVNGTQVTTFSTETYPTQNLDTEWNRSSAPNIIGGEPTGGNGEYISGSMSHVHFIDGTAYDASAFGETDATTGIWKPKTAPSVTYGTNGFFLKFENSGSMGTDSSGNANNFTVNGTMTQTIDTPSNFFATLNPLDNFYCAGTFSNGNNTIVTGSSEYSYVRGTLGVSQGKWYYEAKAVATSSANTWYSIGWSGNSPNGTTTPLGNQSDAVAYQGQNGTIRINTVETSTGTTFTTGDIIGTALDLDNNLVYFYKNGTLVNSGGTSITASASTTNGIWCPAVGDFDGTGTKTWSANFGNGYFGTTPVASAQNPDDGIGIFEYTVPTGYKALCTKSINAQEYS